MAVDVRSRYFAEPEEFFMPDEGMMMPSFSAFPQGMPQPSAFGAMPMSGAAQPMMPSFSAFPQAMPQPSPFEVMPMSGAAPIMDTPREAAVMPMTQEAAPFDLSSLAGLDLSGLGGFGGGRMGGVIQDPNLQYIAAPLSNKGNPTSQTGGNTFAVRPDQPVRLVDHRTNQVVFEGSGYDAARKATELGQGLTDQFGRKANYSIQTADPTGAYNTVAYEKKNKSTLGKIANVAGTVLPIAVSMIPGLQVLGPVLSQMAAAGAGAALKGNDPLKAAALAGLTAGGGQVLSSSKLLGPAFTAATGLGTRAAGAIGSGLGATAGGLATGQSLKSSLLGGAASGALSYAGPTIQQGLGINPIPGGRLFTGSTPSVGADGYTGLTVTGGGTTSSPNFTLGGSPNKIQQALAQGSEVPYDGITAIGNRLGNAFGVNFGGDQFGAPGQDQSAFDRLTGPTDPNEILVRATPATQPSSVSLSPDVLAGMAEFGRNPIISEGSKIERPTSAGFMPTDFGVIDRVSGMENYAENPIDVIGSKRVLPEPTSVSVMPPLDPLPPLDLKPDPELTDKDGKKLSLADALALLNLVGGIAGGGGGGGGGTPGSQAINPIFSAKLPTPGKDGAFKVGGLDYTTPPATDAYRYAMGPAMDIPAGMNLSGATSPYAGYGPGTLGEETFKRVTGMAHGGAMGYARGSSRDSFAVDGPGTGRSDDIPAVLSDGEYVIDAETVALLGDGSSKAGAKKLDEMRVKVRKHKGRNLAKGKFSVNAKRPEKYLSGGRT